MKPQVLAILPLFAAFLFSPSQIRASRPGTTTANQSWQRVTAHINGVFSPRGYFNLLVGLYSLPTLQRAQFNLGASTIVMDFPPGSPEIGTLEIQGIETRAGYRPGPVTSDRIASRSLIESGTGWVTIKHARSRNFLTRWIQQNF